MVDVHDIDALLISALYGELTPADEARLAAHLESHPTDRTALADLTRARSLVKDSRILTFQLDPPQAVSALLLQEAARRAPAVRREPANDGRESWFFRFVRSFSAHPAMAAAAMLVLVVGAAGVMKMRDRGDFADKAVDTRRAELTREAAPAGAPVAMFGDANLDPQTIAAPAATATPALDPTTGLQGQANLEASRAYAAGSSAGYTVGLADNIANEGEQDEKKVGKPAPHAPPMKPTMTQSLKKGISVTTPQLALKEEVDGDLDDAPRRKTTMAKDVKPSPSYERAAPLGASGGAATPPPPATVTTAIPPMQQPTTPAATPPADKAGETDHRGDPALVAWATAQLQQVVQLAKDNKCEDAARMAASISARAPDYYAQNVATNRELKQCMAYIAAAHDRAEKAAAEQRASKAQSTVK